MIKVKVDPRAYKVKVYKTIQEAHKWELEYKAIPGRSFRCDFADPILKIAVEYEGISRVAKGGGHANKEGLLKDIEKYNLLASHGWVLVRFSYQDARRSTQVKSLLEQVIKIRREQLNVS